MFSLILTIIAIALAVALAVATIYYGGDSSKKAMVKATATTVINQAHQILGANQVFYSQFQRWPTSPEELVEKGFLQALPEPPARLAPPDAAAETPWTQVQARAPQYWIRQSANTDVCRSINLMARGDNGIKRAAQPGIAVQCYGTAEPFTVIVHQLSSIPLPESEPDGGAWTIEPDASVTAPPTGPSGPTIMNATPSVLDIWGYDENVENVVKLCTSVVREPNLFNASTSVTVNGVPVVVDRFWTEGSGQQCLEFFTPELAEAVVAPVVVSTANGSLTSTLHYKAPPSITSFSPATGSYEGRTIVTVRGSGFLPGAKVFDYSSETELPTTYVNSETLLATVQPGITYGKTLTDLARGTATVTFTVVSPTFPGRLGESEVAPEDFYFTSAPPDPEPEEICRTTSLSGLTITPNSGSIMGGDRVVLTGNGILRNCTWVFMCSTPECGLTGLGAKDVVWGTDGQGRTSLEFTMFQHLYAEPNAWGTFYVGNGIEDDSPPSAFNPVQFFYTQSTPSISSITPPAPTTSTLPLTLDIYGSDFMEGATVSLMSPPDNGTACYTPDGFQSLVTTFVSSSHLKVTLQSAPQEPFGTLCATTRVTNPDQGKAVRDNSFRFTASTPPPSGGNGGNPGGAGTVSVTFFGNWTTNATATELVLNSMMPESCLSYPTISTQNDCAKDVYQAQLGAGASCSVTISGAAAEVKASYPSAQREAFLNCTGVTQANISAVASSFPAGYKLN